MLNFLLYFKLIFINNIKYIFCYKYYVLFVHCKRCIIEPLNYLEYDFTLEYFKESTNSLVTYNFISINENFD